MPSWLGLVPTLWLRLIDAVCRPVAGSCPSDSGVVAAAELATGLANPLSV